MSEGMAPSFRPTIVVLVGDTGQGAGEQLAQLLQSAAPALRAGVALLSAPEGWQDPATGETLAAWFDPEIARSAALMTSTKGTGLPYLAVQALRGEDPDQALEGQEPRKGVLDETVARAIIEQMRYEIPSARVAIWIVGEASSGWINTVIQDVRAACASEGVESWLILALSNRFPSDPSKRKSVAGAAANQPWDDWLVWKNNAPAPVTFAYLFEPRDEQGRYWAGPDDIPFAIAEAIFVVTASGMSVSAQYENTLRRNIPLAVREPWERIGSLGTSRLAFPRGHVERYCASELAIRLLKLLADQKDAADDATRQRWDAEEERRVASIMGEINGRIEPSQRHMRGGRRPAPPLSARAMIPSRAADGGLIFPWIRGREVERTIARASNTSDARLAVQELCTRADRGWDEWRKRVRPEWERYETELELKSPTLIEQMISLPSGGVSRAKVLSDKLRNALRKKRRQLAQQRISRAEKYDEQMNDLLKQGVTGAWAGEIPLRPGASPASGQAAQGAPTMAMPAVNVQSAQTSQTSAVSTTGGQLATSASQSREDQVITGLITRYRYHRRQIPSRGLIAGAALTTGGVEAMLAQPLLAAGIGLPASWTLATLVGLAVVFMAVTSVLGLWIRGWRARTAEESLGLLVRALNAIYTNRCERYEDQLRDALITVALAPVERLVERLKSWSDFVREVAVNMRAGARAIEAQVYDGAMAQRDLLVANGQALRRDGYTLSALETAISSKRMSSPIEPWHGRDVEMPGRFFASRPKGARLLVSEGGDELAAALMTFCLAIVRLYIGPEIGDVGAVLENRPANEVGRMFDMMVGRAIVPLYIPQRNRGAAILFAAGRPDLSRAISAQSVFMGDAVESRVTDREWVSALRLTAGGAPPAWWTRTGQTATNPVLAGPPSWLTSQAPPPAGPPPPQPPISGPPPPGP